MSFSGTMPHKKSTRLEESKHRKKKSAGAPNNDDVDDRGNIRNLIDYDYDSENESSPMSEEEESPIARRTRSSRNTIITKLENEKTRLKDRLNNIKKKPSEMEIDDVEDEEDEEYDEDEDEDEDEEYDEDEDEDEEGDAQEKPQGISISFGLAKDSSESLVPKRHNMKKETEDVNKFVKLVTQPSDENTIDNQIDQFKAMPIDQQKKLISVLERKNSVGTATNPSQSLMFKLMTMNLGPETQVTVLNKYQAMQNMDPGSSEYFKQRAWLEKLSSLPLGIYKDLPVKIEDGSEKCNAFMTRARKCLDDAIFGQEEAKLQVLQFIGTRIANPGGRGLSLMLAGPPGIGKTSLIKNGIAKALEWPFQFISLGGDSDASTYTGHQLVYESSHCGKIVNSLVSAKSMSMILMFDEVDKISATPKGEEVQNLLVHITDPVQNGEFEDKYLAGINIDLSRSMFVFSANDLGKIDRILLDRFVVIQLAGYSSKEKATIAENYLIPQALKELGLDERVAFSKEVVPYIIEQYANEEVGVRELKRSIEQIAQKINMLRLFNTKELPFHIKDFQLPFLIKKEHIDLFLKKKESRDMSFMKMYS